MLTSACCCPLPKRLFSSGNQALGLTGGAGATAASALAASALASISISPGPAGTIANGAAAWPGGGGASSSLSGELPLLEVLELRRRLSACAPPCRPELELLNAPFCHPPSASGIGSQLLFGTGKISPADASAHHSSA